MLIVNISMLFVYIGVKALFKLAALIQSHNKFKMFRDDRKMSDGGLKQN